ncbi:zinc-dependent peptidase [Shewanella sp. AS16]|uniref:M90 family metallopeptidase n=1 Tax=Shewanella sp. AS16 TaxID=2907625 RepID=UPI001F1E0DFA|nr:M90 family metallopeptidase [Shewanella sp. AS16]MCE9686619.1 zinc-dependent peptidase [Shewanella sp. AS16]
MLTIAVTILLGGLAIGWIVSEDARTRRRRAQILKTPFPKAWRSILKKRLPYFKALPTDLQLQLKKHIQIFIHEKRFIGCNGFEIDDDVRVTIAAQACLLLLNRKTDYYPKLKDILVYPNAFIVKQQQADANGIVWDHRRILAGESWGQGKVILSWTHTLVDAAEPYDGNNVVIHEFAHQLDQEGGQANGAPLLSSITDYPSWSKVLGEEFAALQRCAAHGLPSIFNYYGATNPAEFFAVISEVFFERPEIFYQQHPALYTELSHFYRLDPVSWH